MGERAEDRGLKIPQWAIAIVVGLVASFSSLAVTWGARNSDIASIKRSIDKFDGDHDEVTSLKTTVPVIKQDVADVKNAVKTMSEKQDRQYESIMSALRQH